MIATSTDSVDSSLKNVSSGCNTSLIEGNRSALVTPPGVTLNALPVILVTTTVDPRRWQLGGGGGGGPGHGR